MLIALDVLDFAFILKREGTRLHPRIHVRYSALASVCMLLRLIWSHHISCQLPSCVLILSLALGPSELRCLSVTFTNAEHILEYR